MTYRQLKSYLSQHNEYETEFIKRFEGFGTFVTSLYPLLLKHRETSRSETPLFAVPLREIQLLSQELMENSEKISELALNLPDVAKNQLYRDQLYRAIISSNEIEGVRTTHQEVSQAYEVVSQKTNKPVRLRSTLQLYDDITHSEKIDIERLKDIRDIYNQLIDGEISKEDMPNGKLFRERIVGTRTIVGKHIPPQTEDEISGMLQSWIDFINNHDFPFLIRATLGHYFFENVHPFKDGNGRIGRYIFSRYLSKKLDIYSGLIISQKVNENRKKYYQAFEVTGDANNRAEGTFFVKQLLELVQEGQREILQILREKTVNLEFVEKVLAESGFSKVENYVMYLLYQSQLFTDEIDDFIKDTEIHKLAKISPFSVKSIQRAIKELENKNVIELATLRPLRHRIVNPVV